MVEMLRLFRFKSWLKNIFVFVPIIFAMELFNEEKLASVGLIFVAFCLVSSAVYICNDIFDARLDALHPVKKLRPIASGKVSKGVGVAFLAVLLVASLVVAFLTNIWAGVFVAAYAVLNFGYTVLLKRVPIFDVFCIAAGFIFRIYAGGFAAGVEISDWLFLTVVAMALFMAFGKRRGELEKSAASREVLLKYDLGYLSSMVSLCAGLTIVFYSLWAMSRDDYMVFTVPVVIFIVARYLFVLQDSHGDPTSIIYSDKIILVAGVLYGALTVALLYI
jgi:4-hydroxybenzoate polyprenyltransferase